MTCIRKKGESPGKYPAHDLQDHQGSGQSHAQKQNPLFLTPISSLMRVRWVRLPARIKRFRPVNRIHGWALSLTIFRCERSRCVQGQGNSKKMVQAYQKGTVKNFFEN